MNYRTSTQRKYWLLTAEEIDRRRKRQRCAVLEQIETTTAKKKKKNDDVDVEDADVDAADADADGRPVRCVEWGEKEERLAKEHFLPSERDEGTARKRLEAKIDPLCRAFNLPVKVCATATMLFKRFCLERPTATMHLKIVMVACVYVACKVEESYVSAEQLCKVVKDADFKKVLAAELAVLQGVNFELVSFSAFRPLRGFRADAIHSIKDEPQGTNKMIRKCYDVAIGELKRQMLTDLPLMYPPGQLALSAFMKAARCEKCRALEEYIATKCCRKEPEMLKNLEKIEEHTAREGVEPREEDAKRADQAIKAFQKMHAKTLGAMLKQQASKENLVEEGDAGAEKEKRKKQKVMSDRAKEDAAFDEYSFYTYM